MNGRRRVLRMVEEGRLTPEEALPLWLALGPKQAARPQGQTSRISRTVPRPKEDVHPPLGFRVLPWALGGAGVLFLGGAVWAGVLGGGGWLLSLLCLLPMGLLGLLALGLAWSAWRGVWVWVSIRRAEGAGPRHLSLGLPIPVGWLPLAWRLARPWMDEMWPLDGKTLRQMAQVLHQEPLWLTVDDEDGTQVRVWLGRWNAAPHLS